MFQDFVTVFNLAYCCHKSHFLAETDCWNLFWCSPPCTGPLALKFLSKNHQMTIFVVQKIKVFTKMISFFTQSIFWMKITLTWVQEVDGQRKKKQKSPALIVLKVKIFWECYKILGNVYLKFDIYHIMSNLRNWFCKVKWLSLKNSNFKMLHEV